MYSIKINFEQKGLESVTLQDVKADESLLEVLLDAGIELHHNCGMVCGCSTCHLYVNSGDEFLEEISDREEDFIDRARNPKINSRLGCQCILLEQQQGVINVTIPDQSIIHGE